MKFKSLEEKLELYYSKITNPTKVINNWAIIDIDAFNKLSKITLHNINNVSRGVDDSIITTESKNNYIIIKYSPSFIATKVIDKEYDYLLKDWDLIAVDRQTLHKGETDMVITSKEIIKLLGFKLTKNSRANLDYFD